MSVGLAVAAIVAALLLGAALGWLWRGERDRAGVDDAVGRLRESFQALSAEALRSNQTSFLELARTSLAEIHTAATGDLSARHKAVEGLVAPVREALQKVDAKLQAIEKEREGAYRALRQQVESMGRAHERLGSETSKLAQALRSPSVRGRWGEIQLKRVVELAGMAEHSDFTEQATVVTDEGRFRPDLVVRLPGGKNVVVDAKAPLTAYLDAHEALDEETRERKLDEHARQVRDHITRLGGKTYWEQLQDTPEFVVMFIPGEAFLAAACRRDPDLLEYGFSKNVLPASPTNLISLLKTVYHGWQEEKVGESAQKIRELGSELYDRLLVLAKHFADLGNHLDRAVRAYDDVGGSFERRVLVAARRLKDLGAGTSREVPEIRTIDSPARFPGESRRGPENEDKTH